jgi:hypothetical protein
MHHAACRHPPNPPVSITRHRVIRYTGERCLGKRAFDAATYAAVTLTAVTAAVHRPHDVMGRLNAVGRVGAPDRSALTRVLRRANTARRSRVVDRGNDHVLRH